MASGQTTNSALNQWAPEDKVLREEFNGDNAKIETALSQLTAGVLQTAVGSYMGNGQYGSEAPNRLEFAFTPKLVILVISETSVLKSGTVFVRGQTISAGIGTSYSGGSCLNLGVSWSETGLSWYGGDAERQLNKEGSTYFYFALG